MITTIIFDLGGVLLDIDLTHCMRQMQALGLDLDKFRTKGLQAPTGTRSAVLGEGIVANGATHLYQTGDITTEEFMEGVRRLCTEERPASKWRLRGIRASSASQPIE